MSFKDFFKYNPNSKYCRCKIYCGAGYNRCGTILTACETDIEISRKEMRKLFMKLLTSDQ